MFWLRYVHINIGSQELSANHDILQVLDHVVDPVFSCWIGWSFLHQLISGKSGFNILIFTLLFRRLWTSVRTTRRSRSWPGCSRRSETARRSWSSSRPRGSAMSWPGPPLTWPSLSNTLTTSTWWWRIYYYHCDRLRMGICVSGWCERMDGPQCAFMETNSKPRGRILEKIFVFVPVFSVLFGNVKNADVSQGVGADRVQDRENGNSCGHRCCCKVFYSSHIFLFSFCQICEIPIPWIIW